MTPKLGADTAAAYSAVMQGHSAARRQLYRMRVRIRRRAAIHATLRLPEWAMPTYKIGRIQILAFAAIVMFPYMPGHDSPAFKGISIFFGVLLSLGSAGAIGNIIAGVVLTYTRAFRVGDRVKIADTVGDVKNEDVTVPNSLVLASHVVNYNSCRDGRLILHTSVRIGYDASAPSTRAARHYGAGDFPYLVRADIIRAANCVERLLCDVRGQRLHRKPPRDAKRS